jgi:RNA polymerase sigma-70 factor (ECF subfamily)
MRPRSNLPAEAHGALAVAGAFAGRAQGAQPAIIDGFVGAIWALQGRPLAAFEFRIAHGRIVGIEVVGDPERLDEMDVEVLS